MKKMLLFTCLGSVISIGCQKKIDTDQRKLSYAIGQQIGNSIKSQKIDVDPEYIALSIKDAQKGENKLGPEGVREAMNKLQESMMQRNMKESEDNKAKATEFLEKNKTAEGVKVTSSGLQYIVEKEGTGKAPTEADVAKVHYKGTFSTGEEFDSSYKNNKPAEFPVMGVVKGFTEALLMMKVGGKMKIFVPPDLGYGPSGRPGIPPNSLLIFEIELLDIVPGAGKMPSMPGMEKKTPPAAKKSK